MIPYASTAAMSMSMNMNMNMRFPGNSSLLGNSSRASAPAAGFIQASDSSTSLLLDSISIPGIKHDAGLAVEWSVEEQYKLEQGLLKYVLLLLLFTKKNINNNNKKNCSISFLFNFILNFCMYSYADEPNIMKYIKIAAVLHDKTVRDVAMRCRWMTVSSSSLLLILIIWLNLSFAKF